MGKVVVSRKARSVNLLKLSRPMGAVAAFLGVESCIPLLRGAQGCTVFRSAAPTAPDAAGSKDNDTDNTLERTLVAIAAGAGPRMIGICTNGLTQTSEANIRDELRYVRRLHPELADIFLPHATTPDYCGAFQDGWNDALCALIDTLVAPLQTRHGRRINILAGSHLTAADVEEIREIAAAFALEPIVLPDISGLPGGRPAGGSSTAVSRGTTIENIRKMGGAAATLAIGEGVRGAAERLKARCRIPAYVFPRLTGLLANDEFIATLSRLAKKNIPAELRDRRNQLLDAMLDRHFNFGGLRVAVAAEPDFLLSYSQFLNEMGAVIVAAYTTTESPVLQMIPTKKVVVGDLCDIEEETAGCDLVVTDRTVRLAADKPLLVPNADPRRFSVGYRGTRRLILEIGGLLVDAVSARRSVHPQGGYHAALAAR